MTTGKQLFLQKGPEGQPSLAAWWVSVIHDPRFLLLLTCARAETMELKPTQAQMEGGEMMLTTLLTLPEAEETFTEMPSPNLHHNFDKPKATETKA